MPLENMEAIQENLIKLYTIHGLFNPVSMTNDILDNGNILLLLCYYETTMYRKQTVLNEAMDIHAGSSICLGYS